MRYCLLLAFIAGCDSGIDAPDDCAAGELHVIHGAIDERIAITNHAFVNKLSDTSPGYLDVGMPTMGVHVEFDELAANGDTVDARGSVTFVGLDVGNCETGGFPGSIFVDDSSWRFELHDLAMPPYCGGAAVAESVRGCYRAE